MQNRFILTIIGLILISSTGFLVYKTKEPIVLPMEAETIEVLQGRTGQVPQLTQTIQQSTINRVDDSEDEDEWEDDPKSSQSVPSSTPTSTQQTGASGSSVTLSQIALHNSRTSCWTAINGSVYDLTSWIPNHPGGEDAILYLCGIDGSDGYNAQHGGKSKPASILAGFKIGTFAK